MVGVGAREGRELKASGVDLRSEDGGGPPASRFETVDAAFETIAPRQALDIAWRETLNAAT